jgi:hypothetical protein
MRSKPFATLLALGILTALAAAACAPGLAGTGGDGLPAIANAQGTPQAQTGTTGQFVEVTPMSQKELAEQGPGQSSAGGAAGGNASGAGGAAVPPGPLVDYTDQAYKFSVGVPDNYTVDTLSADKLSGFQPKPAEVFRILNPTLAGSDTPDLEAADLEIRIFEAPQQLASAESWLAANGVVPSDGSVPVKAWQNGHVSGIEVCASTMIAPGCSYFVTGHGWIYQLTPASRQGETLLGTFTLLQ